MNDLARRICKKCSTELPLAAFSRAGNKRQYIGRICLECAKEIKRLRHINWRNKNREHIRTYSRNQMRVWREEMPTEKKVVYSANMAQRANERRTKLRMICFMAYGGYRCACCGETEPDFLSFDHINNDGYSRQKSGEPQGGERFYKMLVDQGFPKDFQILCMNCNHGKSRNGGICPHQVKEPSTTRRKP